MLLFREYRLADLDVLRTAGNKDFEVVETYPVVAEGKIISDELIGLKNAGSQKAYPEIIGECLPVEL